MEVHPPHEPVHSWRDALIHIGLMTIGLFIALMLEAGVEYLHHKELVHQARENIRRELEKNEKSTKENLKYVAENESHVRAGLVTLSFMRLHPDAKNQSIVYNLEQNTLSDAAFRTARDTGAFAYMPYDEVQQYVDVYGLQDSLSNRALSIVQHEAESLAPVYAVDGHFERLSAAQFDSMTQNVAVNELDLHILIQFMQELDSGYKKALQQQH